MGNPFDLAGPQFLAFYFVFSTIVILTLAVLRFLGEGTEAAEVKLTDPYLIAQLRAGKEETQRVAAAALLDRKLLDMTDQGYLVATDPKGADLVRRPIEKALLAYFSNPADPKQMRSDAGIKKDRAGEAKRAGLSDAECEALIKMDADDLCLAAQSFQHKRQRSEQRRERNPFQKLRSVLKIK